MLRSVAASCMWCFIRAVVACGRQRTAQAFELLGEREFAFMHMWRLETEDLSQRTRSSIFLKKWKIGASRSEIRSVEEEPLLCFEEVTQRTKECARSASTNTSWLLVIGKCSRQRFG